MTREEFSAFTPPYNAPLVISFVEFAHKRGLSSEIGFSFWDFTLYDGADEPLLVVKTVRNSLSEAVVRRLVTETTPMKVLLVEGPTPQLDRIEALAPFLAATGTGVYVRNIGWRSLPGTPLRDEVQDLQLRLAPRWQQRDGVWEKACTKCGELKGPADFYRSAYRTAKDPYRNICKACFGKPTEKPAP